MAVSRVGEAAANSGTGTSSSPRATMPAGIQAGDIAVMWVSSNTGSESYSSGANWSGWSQNGSTVYNSTVLATAMFVKTCAGTESGQSTGPNFGSARRWTCSVAVIRGATLDQVIADQKTTTSTTTSVPCPAATPSAADALVAAFAATMGQGNAGTSYSFTSGANYTERTDTCSSQASQLESGASISTRQLTGGAGSPETPSALTTSQNVGRQNRWTLTFTPAGQTVAVGSLGETDAFAAVSKRKTKTPGTFAEADTPTGVTRRKTKTVGAVAETDALAALAKTKAKSVGTFAETDALGPVSAVTSGHVIAVGTFAEADTLTALVRRKTRSAGALAETDTLAALAQKKTRTVGSLSEASAFVALGRTKTRTVATVSETDAFAAPTRRKTRTVGGWVEADALTGIPRLVAVGGWAETGSLGPVAERKARTVGSVSETDTLVTIGKAKTKAVGSVTESGALTSIGRIKAPPIGSLVETDSLTAVVVLSGLELPDYRWLHTHTAWNAQGTSHHSSTPVGTGGTGGPTAR